MLPFEKIVRTDMKKVRGRADVSCFLSSELIFSTRQCGFLLSELNDSTTVIPDLLCSFLL